MSTVVVEVVLKHGDSAPRAASLELITVSTLGLLLLTAVVWYGVNRYVSP